MNQILFNSGSGGDDNSNLVTTINYKKKKLFLKIIFSLLVFFMFFVSFYYSFYLYNLNKISNLSKRLSGTFDMTSLYSNSNSYTSSLKYKDEKFSIIGQIKISKIDIEYSIISITTDELLKISPCRFYGPMPNEIGNLCIAGHNYDNSKFFSKINRLKEGDIITIIDLANNSIDYLIYNINEVSPSNTSAIHSNKSENVREVTLITCNNRNGNRIIVRAIEKIE